MLCQTTCVTSQTTFKIFYITSQHYRITLLQKFTLPHNKHRTNELFLLSFKKIVRETVKQTPLPRPALKGEIMLTCKKLIIKQGE